MNNATHALLEQALSEGTALVLLFGAAIGLAGMAGHKRMWVELGLGVLLLSSIIAGFVLTQFPPLTLPGFAGAITISTLAVRAYLRAPSPPKKEKKSEPTGLPGGGEGEV